MKLIVTLGDSFGAEYLIEIVSAHTVLNFGLNFVNAAAGVLHQIAEAKLHVKVRTTADPIIDMDYQEKLKTIYPMFVLHKQMMDDLNKIGVRGYTCTPYMLDNVPNYGEHCAWSESSAVVYLNSVIGARSNREGGLVDLACAIIGKTSYSGLHLDENRKGQILIKISPEIDTENVLNLTSIGLKIGEIAGYKIPVIQGLENITNDNIKNLGAASAATGAVALIHVIGVTPEAKTKEEAFQGDTPQENVEIGLKDLEDVREKYSTSWKFDPKNISVGCPQLSMREVKEVLEKLKGKRINQEFNFWICTNENVKEEILNSELNEILRESGANLTTLCPTLTPLQRPLITNSAKACFYTNATYKSLDECIKIATEEFKNV